MKGDTINIQYSGRDYLIDVVDTKPDDQICVVEADIEVDFREPLDYKEVCAKKMATVPVNTPNQFQINNEKKLRDEALKKINSYQRLDGKALSEKQKEELIQKEIATLKKDDEDFDPRQHKLKHGIRNYD